MPDDFDLPLERDEHTRPIRDEYTRPSREEQTRPIPDEPEIDPAPKPPWVGIAVFLVAVVVAVGWYFSRSPRPAAPVAGAPPVAAAAEPEAVETATPEPLPELSASDAFVRELVAGLSSNPRLAAWLAGEGLVRRYVAAVQNVAEGASPARQLRPLRPEAAFATLGDGATREVDPESFRRYDGVAEAFASLDPAGVAELHRRLAPLLEEAYREVGDPTVDFRGQLARAVRRLLAVPSPPRPVLVVGEGLHWRWADPGLDARSDAEKHLLRTGPANQRRIQETLRTLAAALGLDVG